MTLQVEMYQDAADFAVLAEEWDALASCQALRSPFQTSAWNRLWWQHFHRTGPQVRDELRLYAVRAASDALVAVAPMMLTHRLAYLPLRTRELQFLGADSNMTEMRGMICLPGAEAGALAALTRHLEEHRAWDWIQWRGLPGGEAAAIPAFRQTGTLVDFFLPLPDNWETLRSGLPRNTKEALRKCHNSLARDQHHAAFEVIAAPSEILPALARMLELHAMRAELEGTVQHQNVFAAPEAREFITDYVYEAAAGGGACIFSLRIAGVPVAMRLGFLHSDDLYLFYSGYDPAWGRYSVMTTVVAEAIKWAISQGYRRVNLSTGVDQSKLRWRPAQVEFIEGVQAAPSWRGAAALAAAGLIRQRIAPAAALLSARLLAAPANRCPVGAPLASARKIADSDVGAAPSGPGPACARA